MLVQSSYNEGDILVFKLTNGEEVLGKLVSENAIYYKVKKPASVGIIQNEKGEPVLDMQPSVFCMDINKSVEIQKSGVAIVTTPRDDIKKSYIQSTSGIQVAGANAPDGLTSSSQG